MFENSRLKPIRLGSRWLVGLLILTCPCLGQIAPREDYIRMDPERVVLAEACGECHRSAFALWKQTAHALGFDTLHRKEAALGIARSMGFDLVKRESLCLKCHYTPVVRRGSLRAAAGVSCESCHGAARDWINVHNVYGVRESDFQKARLLETPQHRADRFGRSEAAGMLRPSDLYAVASNCYQCHTVPHENLVNIGRHSTGSPDFELVEWSENIRHNFLQSFLTSDGTRNAPRESSRKRVMYFVGRALDLEYSLRGAAAATEKGRYLKAMVRRARNALGEMKEIAARTSLPEAEQMLEAVRGLELELGQHDLLVQAAERVADAARAFLARYDGSELASLDPLYSGRRDHARVSAESVPSDAGAGRQPELPPQPGAEGGVAAPGVDPSGSGRVGPATPAAAAGEPSPLTVTEPGDRPAETAPPSRPGRILRRPPWQPEPRHATIGPDKCASCHRHSEQDEWWFEDPHYQSADPLLAKEKKPLQIAISYGLTPRQMARGDQICMQCHGSVVSGKETREVDLGVGCESCHGAGADFREPHQEQGGYARALGLGMIELKDAETRARTCAGCHYITEPRLLSTGHPSGTDFDFVQANTKIRHWKHALAPAERLKSAYQITLNQRGVVPSVRVQAVLPPSSSEPPVSSLAEADFERPPGSASSAAQPEQTPASASGGERALAESSPLSSSAPIPPPDSPVPPIREDPVEASGMPEKAPLHQLLLAIKERLEALYQQAGPATVRPR